MSDDSDTESFHSAEGNESKSADVQPAVDGGTEKCAQDAPDGSPVPDSPKLSRPATLQKAEGVNKSSQEQPMTSLTETTNDPSASDTAGWDVDGDWGDITEADMVTPREDLPDISMAQLAISQSGPGTPRPTGARAAVDGGAPAPSTSHPSKTTSSQAHSQSDPNLEDWAWGSLLHSGQTLLQDVLDTVNTGLGVPTPENLANLSESEKQELAKKCDEIKEPPVEGDDCGSVTEESTTLVSGSLDVLETLGKKTFDALTVPHSDDTKSRRLIFDPRGQEHSLSQALRELKSEAESRAATAEAERNIRLLSYAYQFESFEGTAQLEGLEMVSDNCARQMRSQDRNLSELVREEIEHCADVFATIDTTADAISDTGPMCSERDFGPVLNDALGPLHLPYNPSRLLEMESRTSNQLATFSPSREASTDDSDSAVDTSTYNQIAVLQVAILAEFTARCVELMHKVAQLLLAVPQTPAKPESFINLCDVLCEQLELVTDRLANCINAHSDDIGSAHADELLTNLFLEANNSCGYVRNAARLLRPVVQFAFVQNGAHSHPKDD